MILDKFTRKRIYSGQAVEIRWPDGAGEPRRDHVYTIQSSTKKGSHAMRVFDVREVPSGFLVTVKLEGDPTRLLGRQIGYTDYPGRAINVKDPDETVEIEPEAIHALDHQRIHAEAWLRDSMDRHRRKLRMEVLRQERKLLEARNPRAARSIRRRIVGLQSRLNRVA